MSEAESGITELTPLFFAARTLGLPSCIAEEATETSYFSAGWHYGIEGTMWSPDGGSGEMPLDKKSLEWLIGFVAGTFAARFNRIDPHCAG